MRGRHLGHRQECKNGTAGLGSHYKEHHGGSTNSLQLIVIDSVTPGDHKSLDEKEAKWIHQLKTMDDMGIAGLKLREDLLISQSSWRHQGDILKILWNLNGSQRNQMESHKTYLK